jgi:hypothetical protein
MASLMQNNKHVYDISSLFSRNHMSGNCYYSRLLYLKRMVLVQSISELFHKLDNNYEIQYNRKNVGMFERINFNYCFNYIGEIDYGLQNWQKNAPKTSYTDVDFCELITNMGIRDKINTLIFDDDLWIALINLYIWHNFDKYTRIYSANLENNMSQVYHTISSVLKLYQHYGYSGNYYVDIPYKLSIMMLNCHSIYVWQKYPEIANIAKIYM